MTAYPHPSAAERWTLFALPLLLLALALALAVYQFGPAALHDFRALMRGLS